MTRCVDNPAAAGGAPVPAAPPGTPVHVLPHPELCPAGLSFQARPGRKLVDELLAHFHELERDVLSE